MKDMIRYILKKCIASIVMVIKLLMYMCLFLTFFLLFSIENFQIIRLSRTMAVTMLTFVVMEFILTAVYGKFDIGKRKSKPIIYSIVLATLITDVVTYLQLTIMNTNANNNTTLKFEFIGILLLVMVVQTLQIIFFAYIGNYIYFSINEPESCLVITSDKEHLDQILRVVKKFQKQFRVDYILSSDDEEWRETLLKANAVFMYNVPIERRTEIIEVCYRYHINVYFNPTVADVVEVNAKHVVFDDISLITSELQNLSLEQRMVKRTLDIIVSLVAIIVFSPFMLVSAIAIKANDGGKILFKQNRVTRGGKIFNVYKFRTMREDADDSKVVADDDRITKVGKFLRKFRIDELPQFFNILKGDMSVVGPRPEMVGNVYKYSQMLPEFRYRLRVKAGLTGEAQISGKYNTSPKDKLILDLMYIENYSIWKDIQLIFQTLIVLLKSDSTEAFEEKEKHGK